MEALAQVNWNNYRLVSTSHKSSHGMEHHRGHRDHGDRHRCLGIFRLLVGRAHESAEGDLLLDGLTFASHAVPGVVVALSFIILYLQPPFRYLGLYGTSGSSLWR